MTMQRKGVNITKHILVLSDKANPDNISVSVKIWKRAIAVVPNCKHIML